MNLFLAPICLADCYFRCSAADAEGSFDWSALSLDLEVPAVHGCWAGSAVSGWAAALLGVGNLSYF